MKKPIIYDNAEDLYLKVRFHNKKNMIIQYMKKFFIILILFAFQNCATYITVQDWNKKNAPVFYSGTRCDVGMMIENGITYDPIYIIDLPFSFILDTILIPISLPFAAFMSRWHKQMYQFASYCYDGESG